MTTVKSEKRYKLRALSLILSLLLCLLSGCTPKPNNEQIKEAVRTALDKEKQPPELVLEEMEVPTRLSGKATVVIWTEDKTLQRNYTVEYDYKTQIFVVAEFTTSILGKDGSYSFVPNDRTLVFTKFEKYFQFSDDFNEQYLAIYVGKGGTLKELRDQFEKEKLTGVRMEQLLEFKECDLGGDTLILLVPRYKGLSVWINEVLHHGGHRIEEGRELARFGDEPVYIFCEFDNKIPSYEIHVSFDDLGSSFLTREDFIKNLDQD